MTATWIIVALPVVVVIALFATARVLREAKGWSSGRIYRRADLDFAADIVRTGSQKRTSLLLLLVYLSIPLVSIVWGCFLSPFLGDVSCRFFPVPEWEAMRFWLSAILAIGLLAVCGLMLYLRRRSRDVSFESFTAGTKAVCSFLLIGLGPAFYLYFILFQVIGVIGYVQAGQPATKTGVVVRKWVSPKSRWQNLEIRFSEDVPTLHISVSPSRTWSGQLGRYPLLVSEICEPEDVELGTPVLLIGRQSPYGFAIDRIRSMRVGNMWCANPVVAGSADG